MSVHYRTHGEPFVPEFGEGLTKQSFKDSTDVNRILARFAKQGALDHLTQYQGEYGDFSNFDYLGHQLQIARGQEIFDALPSDVKREFRQSPAEFFQFVNDPANADRLHELLPSLARPGNQLPDMRNSTPPDATIPVEAPSPETPSE